MHTLSISFLSVFLILACNNALSQVYSWTDENGKTHYSDKPRPGTQDPTTQKVELEPANVYSADEANSPKARHLMEERRRERDNKQSAEEYEQRRARQNAHRQAVNAERQRQLDEAEALRKKRLAAVRGKNRRRKGR